MPSELLDLFLNTTEDYGIILLDPEGRVERWSRGAERLFGYSADEVVGTSAHVIFVPPDRKAGLPDIELQQAAAHGRAEDERWHLRKDGSRFWASGVMVALKENGDLRGFAKVVRDFTERRRLDEAVRQTQKLESVGVLAAGVAHDFNNVLTAILGNISLLRRRLERNGPDEQADKLLTGAERAANRAADLVRQLLNYAGKGRRELQPVDICQVVHDALAIVQASVPRKISLHSDVPDTCPLIPADVGQLQQLVLNLVLNAAEAISDDKGEVRVRVRVRTVRDAELAERFAGYALPPKSYTELVVTDSGAGMDEATLDKIFDPFFTTKFMGRGLGLAAALGVVRSHGGGIAVESSPGRGTTFTVLLPVEDGQQLPFTVSESLTESARGSGLVLVIDDEVGIRSLVQTALEELGYTVITAEHGKQGLDLFQRSSQEISMVVLDVVMPVLDGPETAQAIQEINPDVPILVTSGLGDQDALGRFSDIRIAGFVPKPFAPDQLAQAIAVARQGAAHWAGKDRRETAEPAYSGPRRRTADSSAS